MKDINLIPQHILLAEKLHKVKRIIYVTSAVIIFIWTLIALIPFTIISAKEDSLRQVNAEISHPKFGDLERVKHQLGEVRIQTKYTEQVISSLKTDSIITIDMLDMITAALPEDVYIKIVTMEDKDKKITIEGVASQSDFIAEYLVHLINIPIFENVNLDSMNMIPLESIQVQITQNGIKIEPPVEYVISIDLKNIREEVGPNENANP